MLTGAGAEGGGERTVRVALDVVGGDQGPEPVVAAAVRAAQADPALELLLVGPAEQTSALLASHGEPERLVVVPSSSAVAMDEDPVAAVRQRPDCSVRVATALVRDATADAAVSIGHSGAALAAATFGLGRLAGVTRPALAVLVPTLAGPIVLLDAGGTSDPSADMLGQFALVGAAYAEAIGVPNPRVGLLTIGTEVGKGDALRREAAELIARLPVRFVGGVEGGVLARGDTADVVVTDGFTGNVVLKAIEGAVDAGLERAAAAYPDPGPARALARELRAGSHAGAVLLGVEGVCVVGHGASTCDEVEGYLALAVRTARDAVLARTAGRLAELVSLRHAQVPAFPLVDGVGSSS